MVGIIYISDIERCPYLLHYEKVLTRNGIKYQIIYWNRGTSKDISQVEENHYVYNYKSALNKSPFLKILDFYKFRRFTKKILKRKKYDKLIILTTMSGLIILPELIFNYKDKYIFDYRDASYEYLKLYKWLVKKLVDNSTFTSISSLGFLSVLPSSNKYVLTHNISTFKRIKLKSFGKVYRVCYIGGLRSTEYMTQLIDIFKDDNRFQLIIHGGGENFEDLKTYAHGVDNVLLTGKYLEKDKFNLLEGMDIICYNYPSSFNHDFALANKYYDGLLLNIPLLGNIETYSGKLINENGVGISLSFDDPKYKDKLYYYLKLLNKEELSIKTESLLSDIEDEMNNYYMNIENFINK